jgi:hypothetical protein
MPKKAGKPNFMTRFFVVLTIVFVLVVGCKTEKPVDVAENLPFDGLSQSVFDASIRVRSKGSIGSASAIGYLRKEGQEYYPETDILNATHVEFETNRHVAMDRGRQHVIDVWNHGDLVASTKAKTCESWFENSVAKDLATIVVSLQDLGGAQPVIPLAPYGVDDLQAGDLVFSVGCSDGRQPRARAGDVVKIKNGLVYYDPKSIPGDSGGGLFCWSIDRQQWETVGRTAWAIQTPTGWQGLAMTADRIHDIKAGRVSTGWELPEGAVPIQDLAELPVGAVRLDLLATAIFADDDEPEPLEVKTTVQRWRWPIRGEDLERPAIRRPDGKRFNIIGNFVEFLQNAWRFAKLLSLILLFVFLYVAPTMMTPLSWDWGFKAIGLIVSKVRK